MTKRIKCIVVDDEPISREGLENYIKQIEFLELVAKCKNPVEANDILQSYTVDLIFLDIQMPHITGIEFLRSSKNLPMVIITTAYPSYALEGYQLDVQDYLVKPFSFDRFMQAANKAYKLFMLNQKAQNPEFHEEEYFFIKENNQIIKIFIKDILFIEALQNYISIYTEKKKHITLLPLKNIAAFLPDEQFIQVHKSYLVFMSKIDGILGNHLVIKDFKIPLSRNFKDLVIKKVVNGKLLRK